MPISKPKVVKYGSNLLERTFSSVKILSYLFDNILHFEVLESIVLLNVHVEDSFSLNQVLVSNELNLFEQFQFPQEQMTHKIIFEVFNATFLTTDFTSQNVQARLFDLDELFEFNCCFTHFSLNFVFNYFVASSREQKLIVLYRFLTWSLPQLLINLFILQTYFSQHVAFPINSFIRHLAQWNLQVEDSFYFFRKFNSIAHHELIENLSICCSGWIDFIEKSIVMVKDWDHIDQCAFFINRADFDWVKRGQLNSMREDRSVDGKLVYLHEVGLNMKQGMSVRNKL